MASPIVVARPVYRVPVFAGIFVASSSPLLPSLSIFPHFSQGGEQFFTLISSTYFASRDFP